jgi:hypothetical protein
METGKDDPQVVDKRAYSSPQLTEFGAVASVTQANMKGDLFDTVGMDMFGDGDNMSIS